MATSALKPPLLLQDWLSELRTSDATLGAALSPRANTLAVFTQLLRERPPPKGQVLPGPAKIPALANQENIWLAKIGVTPRSAAQFYSDAYITWVGLQKYDLGREDDGISLSHTLPRMVQQRCLLDCDSRVDSVQNIEALNRLIETYLDNIQALVNRLALEDDFKEDVYTHWVSVQTSMQLFQTILTSSSGIVSGLVGEEMLLWLNSNFVAVTKEEVRALASKQEPWREDDFWRLLVRATVRCLSEGVALFLKMLDTHPSLTLRQLTAQLRRLLLSHPRSTGFATEHEYYSAHRRWRASVRTLKEQIKILDERDGQGEWREGMNDLVGVLEGDKDVILKVCDEDYGGYGWREAISVWGIWVDVETKRSDLPDILALVNETLPIDSSELEQLVQAALVSQQLKRFVHRTADFDPWLAAHAADLLSKMGFVMYATPISPIALPEPMGDLAEDQTLSDLDEDGRPRMTLRDFLLMDYAETVLRGDPGFWRVELDYLNVCGVEGRARMGVVLSRMAFDVANEPEEEIPSRRKANGILNGAHAESDVLDEIMEDEEESNLSTKLGKLTGMRRAAAIADACTEYELIDELGNFCKVISRRLVEERRYGEAIAYSKVGGDFKAVGRIAEMILNEYAERDRGLDEFLALVKEVPDIGDMEPDRADPLYFDGVGRPTVYGSRIRFLAGYAHFHNSIREGDKREAAQTLVRMLNTDIVPKSWWGIVLLDAAQICQDEQLWFSEVDTYDLLRRVEEISIRSEQGSGEGYFGALSKVIGANKSALEGNTPAIKQLEVVRLTLARYLARVFTAVV